MWDLATRENWELILSERRTVTYIDGTSPTKSNYKYNPISPIYATPNSHFLLIGTQSSSALPHWFLGARVSQYLYVSPSPTPNLFSGVQTSEIKRVGLNRLTLIQFPNYDILPYVLQLEIPYWLEDIYLEVWEYIGNDASEESRRLESITAKLYDLEDKVNQLLDR